jgi:hypothetical protein
VGEFLMPSPAYQVASIEGLKPSERRGIVLLSAEGLSDLNARPVFEALGDKHKRALLDRFDLWIEGKEHNNKYFHGWNDPTYRNCFVFKWKEKRQHHRLYGFLCHPQPNLRPRFELCVLVSHAIKASWETDPSELDGANGLRINPLVIGALVLAFPDKQSGEARWKN